MENAVMENIVAQGFNFMLVGMGVVFGFLILMIITMIISSKIITKFFPEKIEPVVSHSNVGSRAKIAAIIAIAKAQAS